MSTITEKVRLLGWESDIGCFSREYLHREGDLASVPSITHPPTKARVAFLLRKDERRVEAFPSDAATVFCKGGERRKQLIFTLQRDRQINTGQGAPRGVYLTPAHTRGRRLGWSRAHFGGCTALLGGSTTRQPEVALARGRARTGRAKVG